MNIASVFEVAEAAKRQGMYPVANVAFAVLVQYTCFGAVTVELETQDEEGRSPGQEYFDLFVLRYEEEGFEGYLCIPAPLVQARATLLLMKRVDEIVERREHSRELVSEERHVSSEVLWARLVEATGFSREKLNAACADVLELKKSADEE